MSKKENFGKMSDQIVVKQGKQDSKFLKRHILTLSF